MSNLNKTSNFDLSKFEELYQQFIQEKNFEQASDLLYQANLDITKKFFNIKEENESLKVQVLKIKVLEEDCNDLNQECMSLQDQVYNLERENTEKHLLIEQKTKEASNLYDQNESLNQEIKRLQSIIADQRQKQKNQIKDDFFNKKNNEEKKELEEVNSESYYTKFNSLLVDKLHFYNY